MFHNCRLYFEPTSALSRMADALARRFDEAVAARVVPHLSPAERAVCDVLKRRFATHEARVHAWWQRHAIALAAGAPPPSAPNFAQPVMLPPPAAAMQSAGPGQAPAPTPVPRARERSVTSADSASAKATRPATKAIERADDGDNCDADDELASLKQPTRSPRGGERAVSAVSASAAAMAAAGDDETPTPAAAGGGSQASRLRAFVAATAAAEGSPHAQSRSLAPRPSEDSPRAAKRARVHDF